MDITYPAQTELRRSGEDNDAFVARHRAPSLETPVNDLTLVADPDALLREEQVLAALGARGYDVLTFDDPVAFRFVYESRYREQWRVAPGAAAALIVRTEQPDLRNLPAEAIPADGVYVVGLEDGVGGDSVHR